MILAEVAVGYAGDGWAVFPCEPRGKRPLTAHGFKDATKDAEAVRRRWAETPDANIGLALPEGVVVVDIDGREALDRLKAEGLDPPSTLTVKTGRGRHLYYRTTEGLSQATLSERGYVIAPPSVHPSGAKYQVTRGKFRQEEIAEAAAGKELRRRRSSS